MREGEWELALARGRDEHHGRRRRSPHTLSRFGKHSGEATMRPRHWELLIRCMPNEADGQATRTCAPSTAWVFAAPASLGLEARDSRMVLRDLSAPAPPFTRIVVVLVLMQRRYRLSAMPKAPPASLTLLDDRLGLSPAKSGGVRGYKKGRSVGLAWACSAQVFTAGRIHRTVTRNGVKR